MTSIPSVHPRPCSPGPVLPNPLPRSVSRGGQAELLSDNVGLNKIENLFYRIQKYLHSLLLKQICHLEHYDGHLSAVNALGLRTGDKKQRISLFSIIILLNIPRLGC